MFFQYVGRTCASVLVFSERCLQDLMNVLVLKKHSKITKLELFGGSVMVDLNLSAFVSITELEIKSKFLITHLPPNLQHLRCDVGMLLSTTQIPDSLVSFHDYPDLNYSFSNVATLSDLLQGKKGCSLKKITVDRSLHDDTFHSLSKRQDVLKEFHYSLPLDKKEHAIILLRKVEKLTVHLIPDFFWSLSVDDTKLRYLTVIGVANFKGFTYCNWISQLEECSFDFCSTAVELEEIQNLIVLHPQLKKCTIFFPPYSDIERFPVVFKDTNFSTHIYFVFGLSDQYKFFEIDHLVKKARKHRPDFFIELRDGTTEVCIRRALSWIPPRHIDFCPLGKASLKKMVLGLTSLKKFSNLLSDKKEEPLVHVDPACIEWMLEGIKESDFYHKNFYSSSFD